MNAQNGYSLVELVVALTLATLVAGAAAVLLQSQVAMSRNTANVAQTAEVIRTSAHVLATETRWSDASRDVRAAAADSLALRAFRVAGVVVRIEPDGRWLTRLDGLRTPDPTKDSVIILSDNGREEQARLTGATASPLPCGPGACWLLGVTGVAQAGAVLLIFESGNYYLTAHALRYRLGAEGRQPLTADLFDDRLTFFDLLSSSAWLSTQPHPGPADRLRVRLPFLNQPE